jgi:predicted TPR repeat methyltransferase
VSVEPWSPEAFEARYAADIDPWSFATSPYEDARYQAILGETGTDRFANAYEPACSVGVLTEQLGARCDRLLAVDVSSTAVARASVRCAELAGVEVRVGSITDPPPADLDLVIMSEVGYYFEVAELDRIIGSLAATMVPGARFVACHWRGRSDDHRLHGTAVHARLADQLDGRLQHRSHRVDPGYLLDTWVSP